MSLTRETSFLMRVMVRLGLKSMAWSLRRLFCPVDDKALVLEVGSGGNPYFRSNVLLDAYEETRERHWEPLVADRPLALGFVEQLPFKNKSFDFVIASHVLEHSPDPARFLDELQRVAKAGYIEVPDAYMERTNPYRDHRLEITVRNHQLIIRKKTAWEVDPELVELYEQRVKPIITMETMRRHPFEFHVRYYWEGKIDYKVLNPEADSRWEAPASSQKAKVTPTLRQSMGQALLKLARIFLSQGSRNAALNLETLLACPDCRSEEMKLSKKAVRCGGCGKIFPVRNGMPVMSSQDCVSTEE